MSQRKKKQKRGTGFINALFLKSTLRTREHKTLTKNTFIPASLETI